MASGPYDSFVYNNPYSSGAYSASSWDTMGSNSSQQPDNDFYGGSDWLDSITSYDNPYENDWNWNDWGGKDLYQDWYTEQFTGPSDWATGENIAMGGDLTPIDFGTSGGWSQYYDNVYDNSGWGGFNPYQSSFFDQWGLRPVNSSTAPLGYETGLYTPKLEIPEEVKRQALNMQRGIGFNPYQGYPYGTYGGYQSPFGFSPYRNSSNPWGFGNYGFNPGWTSPYRNMGALGSILGGYGNPFTSPFVNPSFRNPLSMYGNPYSNQQPSTGGLFSTLGSIFERMGLNTGGMFPTGDQRSPWMPSDQTVPVEDYQSILDKFYQTDYYKGWQNGDFAGTMDMYESKYLPGHWFGSGSVGRTFDNWYEDNYGAREQTTSTSQSLTDFLKSMYEQARPWTKSLDSYSEEQLQGLLKYGEGYDEIDRMNAYVRANQIPYNELPPAPAGWYWNATVYDAPGPMALYPEDKSILEEARKRWQSDIFSSWGN